MVGNTFKIFSAPSIFSSVNNHQNIIFKFRQAKRSLRQVKMFDFINLHIRAYILSYLGIIMPHHLSKYISGVILSLLSATCL